MKAMKQYVKPDVQVIEVESTSLMNTSGSGSDYANPSEAPGDLYDEIGIGEGTKKDFD